MRLFEVPSLPEVVSSTLTNQVGLAQFSREELAPAKEVGLMVLATKPGYSGSRPILVDLEHSSIIDLVLAPSGVVDVTVLDGSGGPVEAATVIQLSLETHPDQRCGSFDEQESDSSGHAFFGAPTGEAIYWAQAGERVSIPWRGRAPKELTLTLSASFELQGVVTVSNPLEFVPGEWLLTVSCMRGAVREVLHVTDLKALSFGPLTIPLIQGQPYDIALEGKGVVTCMERIWPEAEDKQVFVRLEAAPGVQFLGRVSTKDGAEIKGATATISWTDADGKWAAVEILADERGYFETNSVPAEFVTVKYKAPGFCAAKDYHVTLPNPDNVLWVGLKESGPITGQVFGPDGSPVTRFDILAWRVGETGSLQRLEEQYSPEGIFRFEDAPLGELFVMAVSERCPGSNVVRVVAGSEEANSIALTLVAASPVTAEVFDGQADSPISGAVVQLMVSSPDGAIARWGPPTRTDSAGRFSALGVAPVKSWLLIEAQDYKNLFHSFVPGQKESVDLGKLILRRTQTLTVLVRDAMGSNRPPAGSSNWEVATSGSGNEKANTVIGSDGEVEFEGIGPGALSVWVFRKDTQGTHWLDLTLEPGEEWVVEMAEGGGRSLEVELLQADGSPYTGRAFIIITADNGETLDGWQFQVEHGRTAKALGIYSSKLSVTVYGEDFVTVLGFKEVRLDQEAQIIQLVLGGERTHISVVDSEGVSLPGASVTLSPVQGGGGFFRASTGQDGVAEILGVKPAVYVASVQPGEGGVYDGIKVDLTNSNNASIELGGLGSLVIRCEDQGVALPGIDVTVFNSLRSPWRHASSGPGATATFDSFGKGNYSVQLLGDGIWTSEKTHAFAPGDGPIVQQAYRLGGIALQLTDGNGGAVIGAPIELTWQEESQAVSDWIESGQFPEGSSVTDASGGIEFQGIPRGSYAWRATTPAGIAGSGSFVVQPNEVVRVVGILE